MLQERPLSQAPEGEEQQQSTAKIMMLLSRSPEVEAAGPHL